MMRQLPFAVLASAAILACSDTPTESASSSGRFTALIDTIAWQSAGPRITATAGDSGNFKIVAVDSGRAAPITVTLSLYNIDKPGIYPLGVGPTAIGGSVDIIRGDSAWRQLVTGNGGTIVLTHVSPTRIAGKFYLNFLFNGSDGSLGGSNRTVSDAEFDVPVNASGAITVPANAGSSMLGVAGTGSWRAGVIYAQLRYDGTLAITGYGGQYEISYAIANFKGVGTYTIGTAAGGALSARNQYNDWVVTPTGVLTIRYASGNRVLGSISGSVLPGLGSLERGPLKVDIAFDVGLTPPDQPFR